MIAAEGVARMMPPADPTAGAAAPIRWTYGLSRNCDRDFFPAAAIMGDVKRGGRIKVASQTSSTADTVDPAKQNNQTDYTRCFTFYNGLTRLDASLAPQ